MTPGKANLDRGFTDYESLIKDIERIDRYLCLADRIYDVRESEGKGWEGPQVKAYGNAVARIEERIKKWKQSKGLPPSGDGEK